MLLQDQVLYYHESHDYTNIIGNKVNTSEIKKTYLLTMFGNKSIHAHYNLFSCNSHFVNLQTGHWPITGLLLMV